MGRGRKSPASFVFHIKLMIGIRGIPPQDQLAVASQSKIEVRMDRRARRQIEQQCLTTPLAQTPCALAINTHTRLTLRRESSWKRRKATSPSRAKSNCMKSEFYPTACPTRRRCSTLAVVIRH